MRLQDRVAIVTGGGSGIGTAYTRRFLAEGAKVMIADIGEEQGTERRSPSSPVTATSSSCSTDIADPDERAGARSTPPSSASAPSTSWSTTPRSTATTTARDNSLEYLKQVFDVNLHGQWVMAKAVAPHLVRQRWGRIVNVASIAAYLHQLSAVADPDDFELSNYAYMQSKWGVLGLTRHMAGQLGPVQRHRQLHRARAREHRGHREAGATDFQPMFATMSAMRRNTEPEHMVGPAVFFASSDADLVNGQVLVVDGGNVMPV